MGTAALGRREPHDATGRQAGCRELPGLPAHQAVQRGRRPLHGQLHLGSRPNLHQRNISSVCEGIGKALQPGAPVILYSCLTGEGDDNLAADLANTLGRPVIAPTHFWLMQTAVAPSQRISELRFDATGRLTVDTDKFAHYYKKRMDSGKDRHLIAPSSMHELCLQDGFVRRSSRFRPLFQRFRPNGTRLVR